MKTTAIIVAAGSGSRFQSETPKQFLDLAGKPVVVHALERFESAASVDSIALVVSMDRVDAVRSQFVGFSKLEMIVAGGDTRAQSVLNGLQAVAESTSVVAVHDAARPLVTEVEIDRVVEKAKQTGAACLVAPVTDTIKTVRGDEISGTLDREKLRRALTPQVFRTEVLLKAFEAQGSTDSDVTDECYLVEKLGHPIAFVEGSGRNLKITHADDLKLAELLIVK